MPDHRENPAIRGLRDAFDAQLSSAHSNQALKGLHDAFLSRKSGQITGLMKTLGTLPPEERREFGAQVNTLKTYIESALTAKRDALESSRPPAGAVDVTLPGREIPIGRIHPLMRVRQQVEDIFTRMGYEILEGPEVEDDYHNFEALNMPQEHPARDMQDTLYLGAPIVGGTWGAHRGSVPDAQVRAATLLRTHTSAMQIRYMKTFPPPVRIIVPGRVYRRDNLDLSHTPDVPAVRRARRRRTHHACRPQGHARGDDARALRRREGAAASELLPVHGTQRRSGRELPELSRQGMRHV
jgi:phenylalanyl-tRNA synthetase alpha chain